MSLPSGASIIQLTYADRRVAKSHVFHDFAALGIPDSQISMPYSVWVIDSVDGLVLVDTGFDVTDAYWAGDADWRTIPAALDAAGIDSREITRVVLTHLHFDHAGNISLFPEARIFLSRHEFEHWIGLPVDDQRAGFVDPAHLDAIMQAQRDGRVVLTEGRTQVAAGVTMIPAPGHTPGQSAVLVETLGGPRILASDAVHLFEQLDPGWRFFAFDDTEQYDRSIADLDRLSREVGAPIIPGHDSRVRDRYPALPGAAAEFATMIA